MIPYTKSIFSFLLLTSGSPCSSIILTHSILHFSKWQIDPWNFGFVIVGRVDSLSQFYQSPSYELRHACRFIVNFDENHQRNWMKTLLILFQVWNIKNLTYRFYNFDIQNLKYIDKVTININIKKIQWHVIF